MVSLKIHQLSSNSITEQPLSPRTSFSSEFFNERDFISICPNPMWDEAYSEWDMIEFEFPSAGQLFHKPKPKPKPMDGSGKPTREIINWLPEDDPSPRPPKCTILWKELFNLKKSRATSAAAFSAMSSSSFSKSLSSAPRASLSDANINKDKSKVIKRNKEKKGKERMSIRIRPVLNVPICSQAKSVAFSPVFPVRKGRLER
ncbi:pentapeptide repeat-containing protein [Striga asiatica]|uniref:Pentapeptide repeat-containing protein n=1 Tax=Striga asiatica TaxID=4170 RepID=A0A5A7QHB6_STRAF|nr:pentapeptide repeat-containing protein [Striga asiatica]